MNDYDKRRVSELIQVTSNLSKEDAARIVELENEMTERKDEISKFHDQSRIGDRQFREFLDEVFKNFLRQIANEFSIELCVDIYDYQPDEKLSFLDALAPPVLQSDFVSEVSEIMPNEIIEQTVEPDIGLDVEGSVEQGLAHLAYLTHSMHLEHSKCSKYEGLLVLDSHGREDGLNDLVTSVAKQMVINGAFMDEIQQLGRRKFAYNAGHLQGGHYVNYIFDAAPGDIEKIQTKLSLNNSVYLQHYQRMSE